MDLRLSRIAALSAAVTLVMARGYAADEKTSLALTAQQTMPGSQAYVTVMLTNSPAADASQIKEWIEFPKDKLSYVSSRLSIAGDLAEAELKVEIRDRSDQDALEGSGADQKGGEGQDKAQGKADETKSADAARKPGNIGVVVLSITGKRPIPDGPVAEISFKVPAALDEQTITLVHRSEVVGPDGKKVADVVVQNGELKVSKETPEKPPAIFSCFFYMH